MIVVAVGSVVGIGRAPAPALAASVVGRAVSAAVLGPCFGGSVRWVCYVCQGAVQRAVFGFGLCG